eukprot:121564-Alexandrium_andersonii.AAC.1
MVGRSACATAAVLVLRRLGAVGHGRPSSTPSRAPAATSSVATPRHAPTHTSWSLTSDALREGVSCPPPHCHADALPPARLPSAP